MAVACSIGLRAVLFILCHVERVVFVTSVLFAANVSVVCWTEWTFGDLKYLLGAALLPAPPLANYMN